MSASLQTLAKFSEGKHFIIPDYQRGYVWGKPHGDGEDSVTHLLNNLITSYKAGSKTRYFLQSITYRQQDEKIELIDGQQRMTFMYLLFQHLEPKPIFELEYQIRKDTGEIIKDAASQFTDNTQDAFYIGETRRIIRQELERVLDKDDFVKYLKDHVKFLCVDIGKLNPIKIFTMMNGARVKMTDADLMKAELIRKLDNKGLRARYTREWDRWQLWWNREDIKKFYKSKGIETLLRLSFASDSKKFSFLDWQKNNQGSNAAELFRELRDMQKRLEDAYHVIESHNYLGVILTVGAEKKLNKLLEMSTDGLKQEMLLHCLATDYDRVEGESKEMSRYHTTLDMLRSDMYTDDKAKIVANKQLLLRNVLAATSIKQRFDFTIWSEKSLEHVHPQSKGHELGEEESLLHTIGNLVLLYKNNNSKFKDNSFKEKKEIFFNVEDEQFFNSRQLLHSLSVFSQEKWGIDKIEENQKKFISQFEKNYSFIN